MVAAACKVSDETCPQAHAAAKQAVREVFSILGVDVDSPREVEEFRKSLRFGDAMRRLTGNGVIGVVLGVAALILAALVAGIQVKLGG